MKHQTMTIKHHLYVLTKERDGKPYISKDGQNVIDCVGVEVDGEANLGSLTLPNKDIIKVAYQPYKTEPERHRTIRVDIDKVLKDMFGDKS